MSEQAKERLNQLEVISNQVGNIYTPEQIGLIQKQVAKGASTLELAYFLNLCNSVGLNPFNKEIWAYKDRQDNLIIFTSRDGLLRKAQENSSFAGIRSMEVCENDEFSMDVANNEIKHPVKAGSRGKVIGAYAIVFRKGGEPTIEWATITDHKPGNVNPYSPWARYESKMIKKVAESHALKKAFGLASGVQLEGDFQVDDGVAKPLGKASVADKERQSIEGWIAETNDVEDLQLFPESKREKYPDLADKVDQKIESLTINQDQDGQVQN